MKRLFDLVLSICGILFLLPFFIIVSVLIKLDSDGDVIFKQTRVTKGGKEFKIFKFRTMRTDTEKQGQITIGADSRITSIGNFLRKTKLDELPQLFNIVMGDMSFVGPRPEVPKYVRMYTKDQRDILKVRAGITDYASIYFSNESEILGKQKDPEKFYIEKIMPYKIELNKKYIKEAGLIVDIKIIFLTVFKVAGLIKNDNRFEEEF
ncbi:sugar transferase [Cetobacterium sp.]|uniref:sugar transferase n=1 Tax=Cetobacterium sp. TaxID=2071632 RepID=UPI003EE6F050